MLLNEHCLLMGTATDKIQKRKSKKGQAVFTCHARSTLEAAEVEIINEIRPCDLSKWTGNKSLLIGPSQRWRQGGGLWFSFQGDTTSWKLQVSRGTPAIPASADSESETRDRFVVTENSSMNQGKKILLLPSCNYVSASLDKNMIKR